MKESSKAKWIADTVLDNGNLLLNNIRKGLNSKSKKFKDKINILQQLTFCVQDQQNQDKCPPVTNFLWIQSPLYS